MKTMMTRIQTRLTALLTAAMLTTAFSAHAQKASDTEVSYPYAFIGLQGGAQTTFTDYNNFKLITPTAGIYAGVHFLPALGARLHVNGIWNKGGVKKDDLDLTYKYKYATADLDLMVNVLNLIHKQSYRPLNLYLIGGVGLNYAWDNDNERVDALKKYISTGDNRARLSHNYRVGVMLDVEIVNNLSVNLEVAGNSLSNRYNSKTSTYSGNNVGDDWQLTAQLGLTYKFAKKTKKPVEPEVWETRVDTIWYDDAVFTPVVENGTATWNVFYRIRESDFEADEQLAAIGAFLKNHRECKVDIKSYADVETGNPKINMEYSRQRCEKAVKALTDAGVPAASITSSYYGDTVQPFKENDKNRVSIIVATGLKDVNKEDMVKKFRTKEVRYRVK